MKAALSLAIMLAASIGPIRAQDGGDVYQGAHVANFAVAGQADGAPDFETLSFWSGPGGEAIDYGWGSDGRQVRLQRLAGTSGGHGFAVRFPNGLILDIAIDGKALLVSDRSGSYRKRFVWRYEGPVDGRGTFCEPCVPEPLAIPFVRENFAQPAGSRR